MTTSLIVLLTACALHAGSDPALPNVGRSVPLTERTLRVGQIDIEGADDMSASAILNALGFHYGDVIPYRRLREAERRLAGLDLFVVDPATGVRPRIVTEPDGAFMGLRVRVVKK